MRPTTALVALAALSGCVGRCEPSSAPADSGTHDEAAPPTGDGAPAHGSIGDASVDARTALADAARGKELYARYCDFCHGKEGMGYAADEAPALANDDLLSIASDDFLRDAISNGRPGTTMSAWSIGKGGPLGPVEASAIVLHLRTWQTRPSEPIDGRVVNGDAARGKATYATKCARCHGKSGSGGPYGALANPELLAAASDAFLATTIERGRGGTPMPAFGRTLKRQEIDDVVALLRSWQKPVDETLDLPPRPGALRNVVVNPRGPKPSFDQGADFVPVDVVKGELDRKAQMILVDARPPSDYARMHIAGAISVPFYDVEAYAAQIPRDRFILTYCACPHAASVKARDALRALGFAHVAVLDEGILAWRDRGYPVRGGAKP
jgi:cytochrome c oxidase cbb3-type subunit III